MGSPTYSSDDWLEQTVRISDLESYSNLNVRKSSNAKLKETIREHMAKGLALNQQKRMPYIAKKDAKIKNYNKCCLRNPPHHLCSEDNQPYHGTSLIVDDTDSRKLLTCECKKRDNKRCPLRIVELAAPSKRHCLETWKDKSHILPSEMIERLKMYLMGQTPVVEVSDALNCFCFNRKQEARKVKQCPGRTETALLSVIFARKILRLLLPPCCICGFSPELQRLCDVIENELSKIDKRSKHCKLTARQALPVRKDVAKRITLWIMTIMEETAENMEMEEFRAGDNNASKLPQRAKKMDKLITLICLRNMLRHSAKIRRQELEEQEGHVWNIIDDIFNNAVDIIEERYNNNKDSNKTESIISSDTYKQTESDAYSTVLAGYQKPSDRISSSGGTQVKLGKNDSPDEGAQASLGSLDKLAVTEMSSFTNLNLVRDEYDDNVVIHDDEGEEDNEQEDVSNIGEDLHQLTTIDETSKNELIKSQADLDQKILHFTKSDLNGTLVDGEEFRSSLRDTLMNLGDLFTLRVSHTHLSENIIFLPPNFDLLTASDEVWPDDKKYPEVKIITSMSRLGHQELIITEDNEPNINSKDTIDSGVDIFLNDLESKSSQPGFSMQLVESKDKTKITKSRLSSSIHITEDSSKYVLKSLDKSKYGPKSLSKSNDTDNTNVYFDEEVAVKIGPKSGKSKYAKYTQTSKSSMKHTNKQTTENATTPKPRRSKHLIGDHKQYKKKQKFNYRVIDGESPPWGECACGCGEQREKNISSSENSILNQKEVDHRLWSQALLNGFCDSDEWRQWIEDTCRKATLLRNTNNANKYGPKLQAKIQNTRAQFCTSVNEGAQLWSKLNQTTKNNLIHYANQCKNENKATKKSNSGRKANDNFSKLVRLMDGIDEISSLLHDEVVATEYCLICKRPKVPSHKLKSQRTVLQHKKIE